LPVIRKNKGIFIICKWRNCRAVEKIIDECKLPDSAKQDVMFNPQLTTKALDDDLLATTPADLANSNRLSWKYVVKDGVVWEVDNAQEVDSIVRR
jgi:hypothetical protein